MPLAHFERNHSSLVPPSRGLKSIGSIQRKVIKHLLKDSTHSIEWRTYLGLYNGRASEALNGLYRFFDLKIRFTILHVPGPILAKMKKRVPENRASAFELVKSQKAARLKRNEHKPHEHTGHLRFDQSPAYKDLGVRQKEFLIRLGYQGAVTDWKTVLEFFKYNDNAAKSLAGLATKGFWIRIKDIPRSHLDTIESYYLMRGEGKSERIVKSLDRMVEGALKELSIKDRDVRKLIWNDVVQQISRGLVGTNIRTDLERSLANAKAFEKMLEDDGFDKIVAKHLKR